MKVDIAIPKTRVDYLTYNTSDDLNPGDLVVVPVRKKTKFGIVINKNSKREVSGMRDVEKVVHRGFIPKNMLTLYKWLADYYLTPLGEVLKVALPSKILKKYEFVQKREAVHARVRAPTPNYHQNVAIKRISEAMDSGEYATFLLHGITGSGKTEVYIRCVEKAIAKGGRALVLVPEISMTPLLFERFEERFHDQVVTIHSTLSDKERRQIWHAVRDGRYHIVIGPRSTIFVPVPDLKIIIVDEEHDQSYKEHTRMPHYNARDIAVARCQFEKIVAVLGSATPQVESYYNTEIGKYQLLDLKERIDSRPLPAIEIIDIRKEMRPYISPELQSRIEQTIRTGEQVIIFLNRRGFAASLMCPNCGFTARCPYCNLPLVYHKPEKDDKASLSCHICDYKSPLRSRCPKCSRGTLLYRGAGTQRIEELLRKTLKDVDITLPEEHMMVVRLDRDSARPKGNMHNILKAFERGDAKILLGTQLVTKGFDFHDVTLVGIVNADIILHLPDFRSGEKTFQVLTQVAGRSGRGEKPGTVLIQTYHPEQYATIFGQLQNYAKFYGTELMSRKDLGFPPFSKLILIRIKGTEEQNVWNEAERIYALLQKTGGFEIFGPNRSFYYRIRKQFRVFIVLKLNKNYPHRRLKFLKEYRTVKCQIEIDVDPIDVF
ncbi:MAG: primosomal protein N' [candidate division WOR-3 bacterium]|nr:MAG: primosomal protein N' [candidate division WOR-3 bacterium]